MSITSFKGISVNKLSISRLAMKWSGQKLETLSANENESYTGNSLDVRGDKIGIKVLQEVLCKCKCYEKPLKIHR